VAIGLIFVVSTMAAVGAQAAPSATGAAANFCATTKRKSVVGKTPAQITFVNRAGETVSVYWLNYSGQRVFYRKLLDGKRYTQRTYLTHPWLVLDPRGKCVASIVARSPSMTYVIRQF
jgi:hypothetical protein